MNNVEIFDRCANCGACYNICPQNAISVCSTELFYTLKINSDKCVDCGICSKVCPVNNQIKCNSPIYAFAGWHKDYDVVINSSSGGVFYGLARSVIDAGGNVYGAVFSKDFKKVVFSSSQHVDIRQMQKSKYVESDVGNIFSDVKADLEDGKKVLFCGTPCQVAGLHCYLDKNYDSLVTCDFACGGLPSHKLYNEHISELEKKYKSKVISVDFRPKTHGWKRYAILIKFKNGKKYNRLGVEDAYVNNFLYGQKIVRDYCLDCKFSEEHLSDITIADFWKHKEISRLNNENGISLVICNTPKGQHIVGTMRNDYMHENINLVDGCYNNKKKDFSMKQRIARDVFIASCNEIGLIRTDRKYSKMSYWSKLRNFIIRIKCRQRKG